MVFLRRFLPGLAAGIFAAPTLTGTTIALCDEQKRERPFLNSFFSWGGAASPEPTSAKDSNGQSLSLIHDDTNPEDKRWGIAWHDDWDRPDTLDCETVPPPSVEPRRAPKRQRQILLIRHGQYENEGVKKDGVRRLTQLGREQATLTGQYLDACFVQVERREQFTQARRDAHRFYRSRKTVLEQTEKAGTESEAGLRVLRADVEQARASYDARRNAEKSCGPSFLIASRPANIYVSKLLRANETLQLILNGLQDSGALKQRVVTDEDLNERFPCDPAPVYPGHVTKVQDQRAAENAFTRYFHRPVGADEAHAVDGRTVDIIVGHGNLIRYFALRALQLPPEAWLRQSLMHASITSIVISDNGKVKINALGSFGHLPPEKVTVENIGAVGLAEQ